MTLLNCNPPDWANGPLPPPDDCPVCAEAMAKRNRTRQWLDLGVPAPRPPEQPCQDDGGIPTWALGLTEGPQQAEPLLTAATVEALAICPECRGERRVLVDCRWKKCLTCNGTGKAAG